jgi:hypothetical protein
LTKIALAKELFGLASFAQLRGWSAEELLRREIKRREQVLRRQERSKTTDFNKSRENRGHRGPCGWVWASKSGGD